MRTLATHSLSLNSGKVNPASAGLCLYCSCEAGLWDQQLPYYEDLGVIPHKLHNKQVVAQPNEYEI